MRFKHQSRDFILFFMALCGVLFADSLSKTSALDSPKITPNSNNIDHICRLIAGIPNKEDNAWLKAQGYDAKEFSGYAIDWSKIYRLDSDHLWMDPYMLTHSVHNFASSKKMITDFMRIVPDSLSRAAVLCDTSSVQNRHNATNNMNLLGKGWDDLLENIFINHMVLEPIELKTESDACAPICIANPAPAETIFSAECNRYFGFGAISDAVLYEAMKMKWEGDPRLVKRLENARAAIPAIRKNNFNNTEAIERMGTLFGIDNVAVKFSTTQLSNEERFAFLALYIKSFQIFAMDPTYRTTDGHHNSVGRAGDAIVRLAIELKDVKLLSMLRDTAFAITHVLEANVKYSTPPKLYVDDFYVQRRYNQHILPTYAKAIADATRNKAVSDSTPEKPRGPSSKYVYA